MKLFAITPDYFTFEDILKYIPSIQSKGASFLYLRSSLITDCIDKLAAAVYESGIQPLIPLKLSRVHKGIPYGIHFKSCETELLSGFSSLPMILKTASCHDFDCAVKLLQSSIDYVFVSPVFKPFSKGEARQELFPRSALKKLVAMFGERVVLLGGLNRERINALQADLQHEFSAAGITLFFENAS